MMSIVKLLVLILVIYGLFRFYANFQDKIKFFITGNDKGFKFNEISMLWKLAKRIDLAEPDALYVSVPSLNRAIQEFSSQIKAADKEGDEKNQAFLTTLYNYRTKIDIDRENAKGLDSTRSLSDGQKLRIILPGKGVFTSNIISHERYIIIKLPIQKNLYMLPSEDWIEKEVNVYLWRKGDAGYVFDTTVVGAGVFGGAPVLYLAETDNLLRTQKRKSVRCECNLYAQMYFLTDDEIDFNVVENEPGFKCLLEDISEDGALIRIGGKAVNGIQLKIQFELGEKFIIMFGVSRAVEYDKKLNQSLIHFECLHLENDMRNHILSFVYNLLPSEKKEVLEALSQTEEDAKGDMPDSMVDENNDTELLATKQVNLAEANIIDLEETTEEKLANKAKEEEENVDYNADYSLNNAETAEN